MTTEKRGKCELQAGFKLDEFVMIETNFIAITARFVLNVIHSSYAYRAVMDTCLDLLEDALSLPSTSSH